MSAVVIQDIHKSFRVKGGLLDWWRPQAVYAVKGMSLDIPEGSIYGLIGPNGSGKSTLMKMLLGLLLPDAGSCTVFGQASSAQANRQVMGYLPENPYFYKFLTGRETLHFYGKLCGLHGKALRERTEELLSLVGLEDAAERRLGGYSKGMLQRIGLAQAMVQRPKLLILDEPTAGVDPIGSRIIRDIMTKLKDQGMTIFLCSHFLEQVQEVCDKIGIVYQGCLIAEGSTEAITADAHEQEIRLRDASPELLVQMKELAGDHWLGAGPAHNKLESVFLRSIMERQAASTSVSG